MPGAYNQASIESHFEQTNRRLRDIESMLATICQKLEIDYKPPMEEVPQEVIDLAESGKTLEAVKRYRELTNATSGEAMEIVQGL
jgi:ferritin-like metal-binding protein YciE